MHGQTSELVSKSAEKKDMYFVDPHQSSPGLAAIFPIAGDFWNSLPKLLKRNLIRMDC